MITVQSLTKKYAGFTAVDDVTFTARRPGHRLSRAQRRREVHHDADHGRAHPRHLRIRRGLRAALRRPAQPGRGRRPARRLGAARGHGPEILTVAQRMMGLPKRVDEMLDLVSLSPDEAGRRVRNYSLGMRQRLGIATALLGDPGVLILDEPANGLDPAGIRWMRDLLRDYADGGATVLLSSHLLHEIEVIADDLVVIGQGRIVAQGTKTELLEEPPGPWSARAPPGRSAHRIRSRLHPQHRHRQHRRPARRGRPGAGRPGRPAGRRRARAPRRRGRGLEEMFLELTADTQREGAAA